MNVDSLLDNFDAFSSVPGGTNHLRSVILGLATRGDLSLSRDGWVEEPLGDIATYGRRSQVGAHDLPSDAWILDLEDVEKGTSTLLRRVTMKERPTTSSKASFFAGDLLYGKLRPYLDKVLIADEDGYCTTEIVPIVPSDRVTSAWLRICLKSPQFLEYVASRTYGVKMPRLGTKDALASVHPVPPLTEQHRLVAKVDELTALCDEFEMCSNVRKRVLEGLRNSLFARLRRAETRSEAVNAWDEMLPVWSEVCCDRNAIDELRDLVRDLAILGLLTERDGFDQHASAAQLQELEAIGNSGRKHRGAANVVLPVPNVRLPVTWEWARFNEVATIEADLVDPAEYPNSPHVAPDSILKRRGRLLGYRSIIEDGVTSAKHRFHSGQILYSKIRPALSKAVLVEFDGLCSADMYPIESKIDGRYLLNVILSPYFVSITTADDNRLAMPKVNQKQLNAVWIPVPPPSEQRRIAELVDELMAMCDDLESALDVQSDIADAYSASVLRE